MARTKAEDDGKRHEIAREYAERIAVIFDCHTGGISKQQLASEAEIPEKSVGYLMVWLRKHAVEMGFDRNRALPKCLRIGGEWIYGWAQVLDEHLSEHYKRRKNEAAQLFVSVETLTQSCKEHPEQTALQRELASAKARLIIVDQEMAELAGQIRSLRREEHLAA
jgi:hypothetical protein